MSYTPLRPLDVVDRELSRLHARLAEECSDDAWGLIFKAICELHCVLLQPHVIWVDKNGQEVK